MAAEIDAEIREIIDSAYEQCRDILEAHRDQMINVAEYLIGHEKIDGEEFKKLMTGELKAEPVTGNSGLEGPDAPERPAAPKAPVPPEPLLDREPSDNSDPLDLPDGDVGH